MRDIEEIILKRILSMEESLLQDAIETLLHFGITFYNAQGEVDLTYFNKQCVRVIQLLEEVEEPDLKTEVRPQLMTLMATIQLITGVRNLNTFLCTLGR